VFSGVSIAQALISCEVLCRSLFVFLSLSFDHCVFFPSSIYGVWLPLWCLQTFLNHWFCRIREHNDNTMLGWLYANY